MQALDAQGLTNATFIFAPKRENLHMALRDGDWTLITSLECTYIELYNIKSDPGETGDLKDKEPARSLALRKRLEALNAEIEQEGPDWWRRLSPDSGGPLTKPLL